MPISKIGSKALVDCSVAAVDIADNSITAAKLAGSIANAKLANSSVTINNTSVSLGASANIAALDWQSVITADGSTSTTGVAGRGYFINTTSAAHTFTLPTSATRGDTIAIKDYAGTFGTNKLTIARNGHNIQGVANNSLIGTNRASVVLVYADVTRGWEFVTESNVASLVPVFISATGGTITTSGNFKIHSFTGDGCFVVSQLGNAPTNPLGGPTNVDYLVVAGGGGSGAFASGGGGAGGYRTSFPSPGCNAGSFPITATTYPITVGGGGNGSPSSQPQAMNATQGSPSSFSTITSTGGGKGVGGGTPQNGGSGGSGGGAGGGCTGSGTGGSGNTPPTSPSQGNSGGNSTGVSGVGATGGGGGGAGATGGNASTSGPTPSYRSGNGGVGLANSITGSPVFYSGGGGGGPYSCNPLGSGTGGNGGGGNGASTLAGNTATNGTINTGGGAGGNMQCNSGKTGGSGIVIIRYKFQ